MFQSCNLIGLVRGGDGTYVHIHTCCLKSAQKAETFEGEFLWLFANIFSAKFGSVASFGGSQHT